MYQFYIPGLRYSVVPLCAAEANFDLKIDLTLLIEVVDEKETQEHSPLILPFEMQSVYEHILILPEGRWLENNVLFNYFVTEADKAIL